MNTIILKVRVIIDLSSDTFQEVPQDPANRLLADLLKEFQPPIKIQ